MQPYNVFKVITLNYGVPMIQPVKEKMHLDSIVLSFQIFKTSLSLLSYSQDLLIQMYSWFIHFSLLNSSHCQLRKQRI